MGFLRTASLLLVFLGQCHLYPFCVVPTDQMKLVTTFLTKILQSEVDKVSNGNEPSASVVLSLRLAQQHNLFLEQGLLERLEENVANPNKTDPLALYVLAIQSFCKDPSLIPAPMLLDDYLKVTPILFEELNKELCHIGSQGKPLTSYFNIFQDVLALCLMGQKFVIQTVNSLLWSVDYNQLGEDGKLSVDTDSMAIIALTCLRQSLSPRTAAYIRAQIQTTLEMLFHQVLATRQTNGLFGDLYSTGLALQALSVNYVDFDCKTTMQTLLQEISLGAFDNSIAASLIIPTLSGRTYLDINKLKCSTDQDNLPLTDSDTASSGNITVYYTVIDDVSNTFRDSIIVSLPVGSTLLDVLKKAAAMSPEKFRSGPNVISQKLFKPASRYTTAVDITFSQRACHIQFVQLRNIVVSERVKLYE
ncbi:cobalamin binding intrinsic factor-like [Erpetoichthys calabaricus]|uniref:cobalamin binding intrinsic factor-like n=1 Tax=Erpetoichthys calabaricus TaxID=27687 RepID=UPI0022348EA9|nr:cobalamin binding intrinsic factor-like [Erpetoichthys calabaricus]